MMARFALVSTCGLVGLILACLGICRGMQPGRMARSTARYARQPLPISHGPKNALHRLATAVLSGTTAVLLMPPPKRSLAQTFSLPLVQRCDDSVSLLTKGSKSVTLIGTAHISEASSLLVRKVIQQSRPDMVMIELDPKRLGRLPPSVTKSDPYTGRAIAIPNPTLEEYGFVLPNKRSLTLRPNLITDATDGPNTPNPTSPKPSPSLTARLLTSSTHFVRSAATGAAQAAVGVGGKVLGKALSSFYDRLTVISL